MAVYKATGNNSYQKIAGSYTTPTIDNLTSTSTNSSLSANQGRVLNTNKVNKSGDTLTGSLTWNTQPTTGIIRAITGQSWLGGHKGVGVPVVMTNVAGAYKPMVNAKTTNGSFTMFGYNNRVGFSYMTQTNIDGDINTPAHIWNFYEDGSFQTPRFKIGSKELFMTPSQPTGVTGDVWIKTKI